MPFIRSTRDKRGYETTLVMHGYRSTQGASQTRVLYLFRTPTHIRLGRQPLDDESREALEHTHPDLSFDWQALGRETVRTDEREAWRGRKNQPPARSKPATAEPPPAAEDLSPLGQALGAEAAARLRTRYTALLHRIARRSRTPEQRDRLTEDAMRLNPEDWADLDTIQQRAPVIESEWEALTADLPARRRGRRGGRRRDEQTDDESVVPEADGGDEPIVEPAFESSATAVIMAHEGEELDAGQIAVDPTDPADPGDIGRDADRGGSDADGTAGDALPGRDQLRQD